MSEEKICVKLPTTDKKVTLLKWRVKEGTLVNSTVVVLLYQEDGDKDRKSFRTHHVGVVKKILIHEGQEVPAGYPVFELEPGCSHNTVVSDLCADCGADLRIDNASKPTASVSMVHSVPDLKVSEQSALLLGKADEKRLLGDKKLVLLVDLDQTLIHTTNDNIPNNIKDIHHFQLYGPNSPWYHTRLRPGTYKFLSSISELYELHICTFGARNYAHTITHILDPKGKLFSHRVLSRDECFNPNSKTGNLKGLFPCGDNMVCIIDDREDVWDYALNLIHVKPYHFFQHTGDINAPPNLQKNVDISLQDNRVDFTHLVQGITIKKKDKIKGDQQMEDGEVLSDDDSGNTTTDNEEKNKNDVVIKDNSDQVEVEEEDDYLLYLEDILKNLHKEYFKEYDQNYELYGNNVEVPDMKRIIPTYRSKILAGKKLVFSGLVPTPVPLTESRAYKVARLLGAEVTENIKPDSTHLVAVRQGTLKASAARKRPDIKTVTPEWLWLCAERWEHVEERLFPLRSEGGGGSSSRDPPAHCSSPEHSPHFMANNQNISHVNKEQDQKFAETLNPLLSFSDEDIKRMAGEVEDMTDDEESCDGDDVPDVLKINKDGNSSSEASLDGSRRGNKRHFSSSESTDNEDEVEKEKEEELKTSQKPHSYNLQTLDINNALTKKAAGNIDINAMGDKALSTYRTQQTMTLDVLNSLHKSLGTCPSSDILADDPEKLKVELMPHQKHAIAWLMWRESQKPHGGILADDMGLGKTLSMISLVLKAYEAQEDQEEDSETDDSFEDSNLNSFKGGTLIICPSSLISQWDNEVKSKVKPRVLDVVKYYGPNRESSARRLAKKHIVLTTYHTVMWDQKNHKNTSPLYNIKWCRIILDEAHTIRNHKSQTSVAVSSLSGINRWALTGTPIHNKEADFFALLKFIKCRPFDEWVVWKRWVGNNDEAGRNRLSLLTKALMLRRTKDQLQKTTKFILPEKTFHTIKVELFKEEKEAYEKVLQFSSSLFATYLYEKADKENAIERGFPVKHKAKYLSQNKDDIFKDHPELDKLFNQLVNNKSIQTHHILVLILRLRQLCCHPCLLKNMLEDDCLKTDGIQNNGDLDIVDKLSRMSIGIPNVENDTVKTSNAIFNEKWISSKIKAVCDMVKEKVLHTDDKAVIVSQWPSVLNLVNKQLSQYNVKTEIFSGAVPVLLRNKIISEFDKVKGGPKILLLSLTAGGVGLNLVVANHLFLVDIHWNPQLEAQACDRIYRVGQQKPVNIYKFICDNTIESSIQKIQTQKLEIASNVFGGSRNVEGTKITLDDLKQIFNINPNKVNT